MTALDKSWSGLELEIQGIYHYPYQLGPNGLLISPPTLRSFQGCIIVKTIIYSNLYYKVIFLFFL
jgi:hypothetical protein